MPVLVLRADAEELVEDESPEPSGDTDGIPLARTGYPGIADLLKESAAVDERPISEPRVHIDRLWHLAHGSALSTIADELVTLITMLVRRVRRSEPTDVEHEVLTQVYQVTAAALAR
ncbi:MAG: hypothetical protein HOV76_12445 [Hamadaea sp.]|nr:hypothetical protein [Hamadaea sp.]